MVHWMAAQTAGKKAVPMVDSQAPTMVGRMAGWKAQRTAVTKVH